MARYLAFALPAVLVALAGCSPGKDDLDKSLRAFVDKATKPAAASAHV